MKIILTFVLSAFFIVSCSHHHKDVEHHHHKCDDQCKLHKGKAMFEKHCAQSVSEGDMHVLGAEEYKLEHSGEIYYFSSEEKLKKFKRHLKKHTKAAKRNWSAINR